jgi:hypothetical protein
LISASFNRTIGLTERFGWESPSDWFVWGLKSLLGPTVLVTLVIGATAVVKAIGRGLSARSMRVAGILRSCWSTARQSTHRAIESSNAATQR